MINETIIREFRPDKDNAFICATLLNGFYYGNDYIKFMDYHEFYPIYQKIIENLLHKPEVIINVCAWKEDPNIMLGFSILESGVILHWVYVKKVFRRYGIAKQLVPDTVQYVTHLTNHGKSLLRQNTNIKYNPFLI